MQMKRIIREFKLGNLLVRYRIRMVLELKLKLVGFLV